jgi:hypothetical protein
MIVREIAVTVIAFSINRDSKDLRQVSGTAKGIDALVRFRASPSFRKSARVV